MDKREKQKIAPFLTFTGQAEEAMRFYASVFPDAGITKIQRDGKDHPYTFTIPFNSTNRIYL